MTRLDEKEPIELAPLQGAAEELSSKEGGGHPVRSYTCRRAGIPIRCGNVLDAALSKRHAGADHRPEGRANAGKLVQTVTPYELTGIDLAPVTIWLDDKNELFAGDQMIAAGWEPAVGAIMQVETERQAARLGAQARELTRRPQRPVAFEHARVFDAEKRTLVDNMTVLVQGDRIKALGPDGAVSLPTPCERVDAHGRALLPGLWDLHVHMGASDGILDIAAGVTTVRLMGGAAPPFGDGVAIGPRAILVGVLDSHGPNAAPTPRLVDDEPAVRKAVDALADRGFAQAKVYNSFKPALVPAFVDEAHKRGLRASGHVPDGMKALDLVRSRHRTDTRG